VANDEASLLERAQGGDKAAFEALLRPHVPMLLAYSRAIAGDHHVAEDVVQETALIAFRNLSHFFPEAEFSAWLKAIARRQALSLRRQAGRIGLLTDEAIERAYDDPSPEYAQNERRVLAECLRMLTGQTAEIVRRHYFDGSRLQDICAEKKLNLNTVKATLFRARRALGDCVRRRLQQEGA